MELWYGVEDGYLRIELDDGTVLLVAASWEEGCHLVFDPGVPATRKGRPTKEQLRLTQPTTSLERRSERSGPLALARTHPQYDSRNLTPVVRECAEFRFLAPMAA